MPYSWTPEHKAAWKRTLKLYNLKPKELSAIRTRLIVALKFKCGVCGVNLSGRVCYLDHDHHSGALRGILCYRCNRFWVAKNSRESSYEISRYLNDPPAHKLLEEWGVIPHD